MLTYIVRRFVISLITLLVIATVIFLMIRIIPGDPARIFAGETATQEDVDRLRSQLNLDKPLSVQYTYYVRDLFTGDMGKSMRTQQPVFKEIMIRLPETAKLAALSILLSTLTGVPVGILSAIKRNSIFDSIASILALVGVAMPVYWLGLELIVIFGVKLKWLPVAGNQHGFKSAILPAITLASFSMALITRMTRAAMLDVLGQDYLITARAKGLKERWVIYKHALRNALIPVVTVVGLQFGYLLGGSILTETIFAWPGLGRLLTESLFSRDYPMVQGLVFVFAALFITVNFLVDLLYGAIDPRIQYE